MKRNKKNLIKIINILLICSMLVQFLIPFASKAAGIEVKMETSTTELKAESTAVINFYVTGDNIAGFSGYLNYDDTVFGTVKRSSFTIPEILEDDSNGYGMWSVSYSSSINKVTVLSEGGYYEIPDDGLLVQLELDVLVDTDSTSVSLATIEIDGENDYYEIEEMECSLPKAGDTYNITYNDNNPNVSQTVNNMPSNEKKSDGKNYNISSTIPTVEGYTFTGWNTEALGTGDSYSAGDVYTTDANLNLYAQWEIVSSTLKVNPNGGVWEGSSNIQEFTDNYGELKIISNPTTTPNGYTVRFNSNGGTTLTQITQTTSFLEWTLTGGGSLSGATYTYGDTDGVLTAVYTKDSITLPSTTKVGAIFNGWYKIDGTRVGGAGDSYIPDETTTLVAQWDNIDYTLTVDPNGGKWNNSESVQTVQGNYNTTTEIADPEAPKGYTVTLDNNDGTGTITDIEQTKTFKEWQVAGGSLTGTTYTYGATDGTITAQYEDNTVTLTTPTRTGYTFNGWYTEETGGTRVDASGSEYMPTEDVTLYAQWTANEYTITFDANGGSVEEATKEVTYDQPYGTLPIPTKEGYNFAGWYIENNKIEETDIVDITEDKTVIAKWTINEYTLTVDPNGGKWNNSETIQTVQGDYNTTTEIADPEAPKGYTVTLDNNDGTGITTDIEQTKTFKEWQVTGGSLTGTTYTYGATDGTITAQYEDNTVTLTTPTRTGYTFNGWYTEATGGTRVDASGSEYMPTEDVILYAQWTANEYTITFDANGGSVEEATKEVTYDQPYGTLPIPTKEGHTFEGWYDENENKIEETDIVDITEDKTVIAKWTINEYTLTVDPSGGTWRGSTEVQTITGEYNSTVEIENPEAPNWHTVTLDNNDGTGNTTVIEQTTRFEEWNVTGGSLAGTTYTFGADNGRLTTIYLADCVTLPTPTRTGYTFNGWYTEATGGTRVDASGSEYMPTQDVTLYAQWTANEYTITFDANQGSVEEATKQVTYDQPYGTLPTPTKEGHTFEGWYDENGNKIEETDIVDITEDKTLTARWEVVQTTLTVDPNGGKWNESETVQTITGEYNSTREIADPEAPKGYTVTLDNNDGTGNTSQEIQTMSFVTWELSGDGVLQEISNEIEEDLEELNEIYDYNSVEGPSTEREETRTIYTFKSLDGTITAQYTGNFVTLSTPTRIGYTFNGWYTEATGGTRVDASGSEYMPTQDVTLYAQWTANEYTITFDANQGSVEEATKQVTYDQPYGTLPTPTRAGYDFDGWYDENNNKIEETDIVNITEDKTLTAVWLGATYTVTFDYGDGTTTDKQVRNEGYYGALPEPTKTGYTFKGWYNTNDEKIESTTIVNLTDDETLTAKWEVLQTTLTVNPQGGTWNESTDTQTFTQDYGTTKEISNPTSGPDGYVVTINSNGGVTENQQITQTTTFVEWVLTGDGTFSNSIYTYGAQNGTLTATYTGDSITLPSATKIGANFLGWYTSDGTRVGDAGAQYTPESDIEIIAQWENINYTLTVEPNGGKWNNSETVQTVQGNYNATTEIADPEAPKGFTVTLDNNDGTGTTTDIEQTKTFKEWQVAGGSLTGTTYTYGATDGTIIAQYEDNTVTLTTPTRIGYTFNGWYTEETGGTRVDASGSEYMPTEDVTLYAQWTANEYTITFDANGGSVEEATKEVTYDQPYGTLPIPTKEGHTFEGWYDENGNKIEETDIVDITEDKTVIAQWSINEYTLTVDPNGGKWNNSEAVQTVQGDYNTTTEIANPEAPNGYIVILDNNDGTGTTSQVIQTMSFDSWELSGKGILQGTEYKYQDGDGTITATYQYNSVQLPTPEREGYSFDGWYTEENAGSIIISPYKPSNDITLYAHWTANQYVITFDANKGTVEQGAKLVTYGQPYGTLPIPTRTGYDFDGWYDEDGNKIEETDIVNITENKTLTAKWLGATYTVTFDYGDGTTTSKQVRNEDVYGQLPVAEKEGYTFTGWFDSDNNEVESTTIVELSEDITLYAQFEINKYTVKFLNDDGSELEIKTVEHGTDAEYTGQEPIQNNTQPGYEATFTGWDKDLSNITEDTEIKATYSLSPIVYTIEYRNLKDSDNSQNPTTYTIEDENIEIKDLDNQGKYIFIGWNTKEDGTGEKINSIDTSKLENIVLYAQWEEDKLYLKSQKYKIGENDIDIYEENDIYLDKIQPETTVSELINNCDTNGTITVINQDGEELKEDDLVGTNMTIKVTRDEEEIILIAVVMDDLDGNGQVTVTDLSMINQVILKKLEIKDAQFKAADLDDNNRITVTDLSTVNSVILKRITLEYIKN